VVKQQKQSFSQAALTNSSNAVLFFQGRKWSTGYNSIIASEENGCWLVGKRSAYSISGYEYRWSFLLKQQPGRFFLKKCKKETRFTRLPFLPLLNLLFSFHLYGALAAKIQFRQNK
jgi:hypothetical protein